MWPMPWGAAGCSCMAAISMSQPARCPCAIAPAIRKFRHADDLLQHRYLQTKSLSVLSGFSELPQLTRRSGLAPSAATLRSFVFDAFCAITMAQKVLYRVCSLRATATPTLSAWDCKRFALCPGEASHMRNVSAQVLGPAAMFSAAMLVRTPEIREANGAATL